MNLLFGIIIDSFKELRDKKTQIELDKTNMCFICGKPKDDFNKRGKGFEHHIKYEHNLIRYLDYLYYLTRKEKTEYTGIESTISEKISRDKTDWFPKNAALSLDENIKLDEGKRESLISQIWQNTNEFYEIVDLATLRQKEID